MMENWGFLLKPVLTAAAVGIAYHLFFSKKSKKKVVRKPNDFSDKTYLQIPIKTPRLTGIQLKIGVWILESRLGKLLFAKMLFKQAGMDYFRNIEISENPLFYPNHPGVNPAPCSSFNDEDKETTKIETPKSHFVSIKELREKYETGETTPLKVALNALKAEDKLKSLNMFVRMNKQSVLAQAKQSTLRYANKQQLSPIDGMIVGIKDEFKVKGLACKKGTVWSSEGGPSQEDSSIVKKLKDLGAVILGVTNMHEIGLGTTGINPNKGYGSCRNPYNKHHITGGSSSGSAAAVASGVCTFAIGTDGGGSVRIPSALCGIVGMKATFGRYSLGKAECSACTVTHAGAICSSVEDLSLVYSLLATPDFDYPIGTVQPPVKVISDKPLNKIRACFDSRWFKDCDCEVWDLCDAAKKALSEVVACVDDVKIAELYDVEIAHRTIITAEMVCGLQDEMETNGKLLSYPTRSILAGADQISKCDYYKASQQRMRACNQLQQIFSEYDVIVTPTTACAAVNICDDEIGYLDAEEICRIMKYAPLGNFTGIPGITVNVGYIDEVNLPVGFQIMAPWYREDYCLQLAAYLESKFKTVKAENFVDISIEPKVED